jgi:hypothetical protein
MTSLQQLHESYADESFRWTKKVLPLGDRVDEHVNERPWRWYDAVLDEHESTKRFLNRQSLGGKDDQYEMTQRLIQKFWKKYHLSSD